MEIELTTIVLFTIVSFVACFIDSIAGCGGLLMLPSYLLVGLPPHQTLGTNKFVATLGTGVAVSNFIRKGKLSYKIILSGIITAFLGAYAGSKLILLFDPGLVGKLIVFLLPLGIVLTLVPKKGLAKKEHLKKRDLLFRIPLICLIVGLYDGLFGPGTGAFLSLSFNVFLKFNLIESTSHSKIFIFLFHLIFNAMPQRFKQQALDYHANPKPGKIATEITKPCETQLDLSLAYTPGVAEQIGRASCRESVSISVVAVD